MVTEGRKGSGIGKENTEAFDFISEAMVVDTIKTGVWEVGA